jgi:AcrR family transcriptional regulator
MTRTGRPRALSRITLEEAASELFLEQGYPATSIDDIARRAGISRATFFNYFPQKSDLLFTSIDDALVKLEDRVSGGESLLEAVRTLAHDINRHQIPLIATQAEAMGALGDAWEAAPARMAKLREIVALDIPDPVWQWAIAGALAEGAIRWAQSSDPALSLSDSIDKALAHLEQPPPLG